MNIALLRTQPAIRPGYSRQELNLARKLQAAATGLYPHEGPSKLFLAQAVNLSNMPQVAHSIMASLEETLS